MESEMSVLNTKIESITALSDRGQGAFEPNREQVGGLLPLCRFFVFFYSCGGAGISPCLFWGGGGVLYRTTQPLVGAYTVVIAPRLVRCFQDCI